MRHIVTSGIRVNDYPKIHCPFKREMRTLESGEEAYVVIDERNTLEDKPYDMDWVFEDPKTIATEKIDGTNVSIFIHDGKIVGVWNRGTRVPVLSGNKKYQYIISGIWHSLDRGYVDRLTDGQHFGELVGPKIQGNPYQLDERLWIPFEWAKDKLRFTWWGKHGKSFDSLQTGFKMGLPPLFWCRMHGTSIEEAEEQGAYVEGIVFHHPDGRKAKLRYDMYPWYSGERHS